MKNSSFKKCLSCILAVCLTLSLTACGNGQKETEAPTTTAAPTTTTAAPTTAAPTTTLAPTTTTAPTTTAAPTTTTAPTTEQAEKSENVLAVEEAIAAIGEVTLYSGDVLQKAYGLAEALTEEEVQQVANLQVLLDAIQTYNDLWAPAAEYQNVFDSTVQLISEGETAILSVCAALITLRTYYIEKRDDPKFNQYMRLEDGTLRESFSDAVSAFAKSEEMTGYFTTINDTNKEIVSRADYINNPPEEFIDLFPESMRNDLEAYYEAVYWDFYDVMTGTIDDNFQAAMEEALGKSRAAYDNVVIWTFLEE